MPLSLAQPSENDPKVRQCREDGRLCFPFRVERGLQMRPEAAHLLLGEPSKALAPDKRLELPNGHEVPVMGLLALARSIELPGGDRAVVAQVGVDSRTRGANPNSGGTQGVFFVGGIRLSLATANRT